MEKFDNSFDERISVVQTIKRQYSLPKLMIYGGVGMLTKSGGEGPALDGEFCNEDDTSGCADQS
jgi:hypothetical protein